MKSSFKVVWTLLAICVVTVAVGCNKPSEPGKSTGTSSTPTPAPAPGPAPANSTDSK